MMSVMLIFQLFLNVVLLNGIYSISSVSFNNIAQSLNHSILYSSISTSEVMEMVFVGINQENFEKKVVEFLQSSKANIPLTLSYYYYNHDGSFCEINQCDSVQLKIASQSGIIKLAKEFNYQVSFNL